MLGWGVSTGFGQGLTDMLVCVFVRRVLCCHFLSLCVITVEIISSEPYELVCVH